MRAAICGAALLCLFGGTYGIFFGPKQVWNGLRLPWNLNPFSDGFSSLPRNKNKDNMGNFKFQANFCENTITGQMYRGFRYIQKNKDATFMLLFDVTGYVAGIQYAIDATHFSPSPQMSNGHPANAETINGKKYYVLTAYFWDPTQICTTGRSEADWNKYGTGNRFSIQDGVSWSNLINIPLDEKTIQAQMPLWIGPKCFRTMGNHYWFNITKDMSCDNFFPFCLLYNKGKLNAFCFGTNANWNDNYVDSPHPTSPVLSQFFKTGHVPTCFSQNPKYASLTTMHVYMTDSPRTGENC